MNKNFNKKILLILPSLLLILTFVSCSKTDKVTVLSPNVSADIKAEENEAKVALEKGHNYLDDNDFVKAKLTYEKAISMDKLNKDIYLEIKDKYVALSRFDDAFYFIQLAISNNADVENMKTIFDTIKSNFETKTITASVFEGDDYSLPTSSTVKINDVDTSIPITWNDSIVNTSTSGTFSFTGINNEFGRHFAATLTVSPNVLDEEYCYVENIYKSNGKIYIDADLVEFYRNSKALEEAIKDNVDWLNTDSTGRKFLNNPYYIRNKYSTIKTYEVSNISTFNLLSFEINKVTTNSLDTSAVPYDKFEAYIKSHLNSSEDRDSRSLLCIIKLKNNVVYDISRQFTP